MTCEPIEPDAPGGKEDQVLDAVLAVLARDGISAVSMCAVAREAGIAIGLMNYYFDNKSSMMEAAFRRIGEEDVLIVQNGMWLTSMLISDEGAIDRGVTRCEEIALAP